MKKVKVLQVFRVRETGIVVHPGQTLNYPTDRADELAVGGWVAIVDDSEPGDPEQPAATNTTNEDVPPAGDEGAAAPSEEANTGTTLTEAPPLPVVPEKQEVPVSKPEKVEVEHAAPKASKGSKTSSSKKK